MSDELVSQLVPPFLLLTSVAVAVKGESCSASNGLPINLHMQVRGAAFTPQNNTAGDELSPQDKNLVSDSQRLHHKNRCSGKLKRITPGLNAHLDRRRRSIQETELHSSPIMFSR